MAEIEEIVDERVADERSVDAVVEHFNKIISAPDTKLSQAIINCDYETIHSEMRMIIEAIFKGRIREDVNFAEIAMIILYVISRPDNNELIKSLHIMFSYLLNSVGLTISHIIGYTLCCIIQQHDGGIECMTKYTKLVADFQPMASKETAVACKWYDDFMKQNNF